MKTCAKCKCAFSDDESDWLSLCQTCGEEEESEE